METIMVKRNADTIRSECDKHEWQDHLITKIVRRNATNLIHRMAVQARSRIYEAHVVFFSFLPPLPPHHRGDDV